jgi:hypothetical protein
VGGLDSRDVGVDEDGANAGLFQRFQSLRAWSRVRDMTDGAGEGTSATYLSSRTRLLGRYSDLRCQ